MIEEISRDQWSSMWDGYALPGDTIWWGIFGLTRYHLNARLIGRLGSHKGCFFLCIFDGGEDCLHTTIDVNHVASSLNWDWSSVMILTSPVSNVERLPRDNSPRCQLCSKVVVGTSTTTVKREVQPVNRLIPPHPRKRILTNLQGQLKKVTPAPQKVTRLQNPLHLHPQPNRLPATESWGPLFRGYRLLPFPFMMLSLVK